MQRFVWGILILMLNLSVAVEGSSQDGSASAAAQYQKLRQEYDRASSSGVPLTDAERLKFVGRAVQAPLRTRAEVPENWRKSTPPTRSRWTL
jgi:hypothetical protein